MFIGTAIGYGSSVIAAGLDSRNIEEFNQRGNWGMVATTVGGAVFSGVQGSRSLKTISRGSTGRTIPYNLREQLGMQEVKSNPLRQASRLPVRMTDPRWPEAEGWIKMARNVNGVEIHFVYNTRYKIFDDFKFK